MYVATKRVSDIVIGSILAIIALPLVIVLGLAVAVTLREWPFFVQERIGRRGETFSMPKLRTLPSTAPRFASKYELDDEAMPRFTRFLRESHLDELPQLFVVPLGKVSLVGPRPKMPDWVEPIDESFGRARTRVPQGCTGLWQISVGNDLCVAEGASFDYFYLQFGSTRMDVWVLWRTILAFVGLAGPISLEEVPRWTMSRSPRTFGEAALGDYTTNRRQSGQVAGVGPFSEDLGER